MKRIAWIIAVIVICGYIVNSYIESNAGREAKRDEANQIERSIKTAVSQMVSRTNAVRDWESKLIRLEPILTIELERLWLQQRPTLFIGAIKDIATHNQSQYVVLLEIIPLGKYDYVLGTELQLSLLSDKDKIDSLLKERSDLFKDYGYKNSVAVVARINSIRTIYVAGEEGGCDEIKIGGGDLLEILYTGDVIF